jgi:tetratricopeptide (TPR) repeat protein
LPDLLKDVPLPHPLMSNSSDAQQTSALREFAARRWSPIVSTLAAITSAVAVVRDLPGVPDSGTWWIVGVSLVVLLVIRFPRFAAFVGRVLSPPKRPRAETLLFRGLLPYTADDAASFFGRGPDKTKCIHKITSGALFVLDGESGCGKSSFLAAAVLPELSKSYSVITFGVAHTPEENLADACRAAAPALSLPADASAIEVARAASKISDRPLLLAMDQFEEIFLTVADDRRDAFFTLLATLIEELAVTVVLAIRTDFLDLVLATCRRLDSEGTRLTLKHYFTLEAFDEGKAKEVLEKIVAIDGADVVHSQSLRDFIDALVREFLRRVGDPRLPQSTKLLVLPVELQMYGMTVERMGTGDLSGSTLTSLGGKPGLLRAFLAEAAEYVFRSTGVPRNDSLEILASLASGAGTKLPSQTAERVAACVRRDVSVVKGVLAAYGEQYLVRILTGPDGGLRYELMHDHLARIICEAPDRFLQQRRDAQARIAFWTDRARAAADAAPAGNARAGWLVRKLAQPIPIAECFSLIRHATDPTARTMILASMRGFAMRSLATALPIAAIPLGWSVWTHNDSYVVERVIRDAPLAEVSSSARRNYAIDWADALDKLGRPQEGARFITQLAATNDQAGAFVALARRRVERGEEAAAIESLKKALTLRPNWDVQWREILAVTAKIEGDPRRSLLELATLVDPDDRLDVILALENQFHERNLSANAADALAAARKMIDTASPDDELGIIVRMAARLKERGLTGEAEKLARRALPMVRAKQSWEVRLARVLAETDPAEANALVVEWASPTRENQARSVLFRIPEEDLVAVATTFVKNGRVDELRSWRKTNGRFDQLSASLALAALDATGEEKDARALLSHRLLDKNALVERILRKRLERNPNAAVEDLVKEFEFDYPFAVSVNELQKFLRGAGRRDVLVALGRQLVTKSHPAYMPNASDVLEELLAVSPDEVAAFARKSSSGDGCSVMLFIDAAKMKASSRPLKVDPVCANEMALQFRSNGLTVWTKQLAELSVKDLVASPAQFHPDARDRVRPVITRTLMEKRRFALAHQMATQIKDPQLRSTAIADVVIASIEATSPISVKDKLTPDDEHRIMAARARWLARNRLYYDAAREADRPLPPPDRMLVYTTIVEEYAKRPTPPMLARITTVLGWPAAPPSAHIPAKP